jgi:hypothetical protein
MHVEFLLEEESCAAALSVLVPKIIGDRATWASHHFQGKRDLLGKLLERLKGYSKWPLEYIRVVVLVDRDSDDCKVLKSKLEEIARRAGLVTKSAAAGKRTFHVLNRIACEELEAWFLGDVEALVAAYPKIPPSLASRRAYRDPDAISCPLRKPRLPLMGGGAVDCRMLQAG